MSKRGRPKEPDTIPYPLRLGVAEYLAANDLAVKMKVSLNKFINMAVGAYLSHNAE
jgi:hypothetical protein